MKNALSKVLLIAVLVLLVPFLIGRMSVIVLERVYPAVQEPAYTAECHEIFNSQKPPLSQRTVDCMKQKGDFLSQSLNRTRNMTRITLVIIGVYYVALMAVWLIRRRLRRSVPETETPA